jgi:hypothetical protein
MGSGIATGHFRAAARALQLDTISALCKGITIASSRH